MAEPGSRDTKMWSILTICASVIALIIAVVLLQRVYSMPYYYGTGATASQQAIPRARAGKRSKQKSTAKTATKAAQAKAVPTKRTTPSPPEVTRRASAKRRQVRFTPPAAPKPPSAYPSEPVKARAAPTPKPERTEPPSTVAVRPSQGYQMMPEKQLRNAAAACEQVARAWLRVARSAMGITDTKQKAPQIVASMRDSKLKGLNPAQRKYVIKRMQAERNARRLIVRCNDESKLLRQRDGAFPISEIVDDLDTTADVNGQAQAVLNAGVCYQTDQFYNNRTALAGVVSCSPNLVKRDLVFAGGSNPIDPNDALTNKSSHGMKRLNLLFAAMPRGRFSPACASRGPKGLQKLLQGVQAEAPEGIDTRTRFQVLIDQSKRQDQSGNGIPTLVQENSINNQISLFLALTAPLPPAPGDRGYDPTDESKTTVLANNHQLLKKSLEFLGEALKPAVNYTSELRGQNLLTANAFCGGSLKTLMPKLGPKAANEYPNITFGRDNVVESVPPVRFEEGSKMTKPEFYAALMRSANPNGRRLIFHSAPEAVKQIFRNQGAVEYSMIAGKLPALASDTTACPGPRLRRALDDDVAADADEAFNLTLSDGSMLMLGTDADGKPVAAQFASDPDEEFRNFEKGMGTYERNNVTISESFIMTGQGVEGHLNALGSTYSEQVILSNPDDPEYGFQMPMTVMVDICREPSGFCEIPCEYFKQEQDRFNEQAGNIKRLVVELVELSLGVPQSNIGSFNVNLLTLLIPAPPQVSAAAFENGKHRLLAATQPWSALLPTCESTAGSPMTTPTSCRPMFLKRAAFANIVAAVASLPLAVVFWLARMLAIALQSDLESSQDKTSFVGRALPYSLRKLAEHGTYDNFVGETNPTHHAATLAQLLCTQLPSDSLDARRAKMVQFTAYAIQAIGICHFINSRPCNINIELANIKPRNYVTQARGDDQCVGDKLLSNPACTAQTSLNKLIRQQYTQISDFTLLKTLMPELRNSR